MVTKVLIIQPVVSKYRVSFFKALLSAVPYKIVLMAGKECHSLPDSCPSAEEIADLNHPTRTFLNGKIAWQRNIWIPGNFQRGDIVVLTGSPRLLNNLLLVLQARLKGMKLVWWGHGGNPTTERRKILFRRFMMKFADVLILYTAEEAKYYIGLGFAPDRVFGLNNTLDTTEIIKYKAQWDSERSNAFKIHSGFSRQIQLLFIGRLTTKCKLKIALDAMQYLPDIYELIVIGDGPEFGGYKTYAHEIGVSDRIHWIGAIYEEENLAPFFSIASCMVYPGNIGLSLIHSFAYGLPVITHNNERYHMPEFSALVNGENGLTFQIDNIMDLAEKVQYLCNDPTLLLYMKNKASELIQTRYSLGHMVTTFSQALQKSASLL